MRSTILSTLAGAFARAGFLASGLVALGLWLAPGGAQAEWPDKPIKVFVGFAAGGGTDIYARVLASLIHEELNTPMVVINKPGAVGMIALKHVADEKSDGYTITMQSVAETVAKEVNGESPVDFRKAFRPLAMLGIVPAILVVPIDSPYKSVRDLVEDAKKNPGKLRWAHAGRGGMLHMMGDKTFKALGVDVKDVPFAGGGPTRAAVVAKQVDAGLMNVQQFTGFDTKLRALAVFDSARQAAFPGIPTMKEQGYDLSAIISPFGVYIRADTPEPITAKLQTAVKAVTGKPGYKSLIKGAGLQDDYRDEKASRAIVDEMYRQLAR